jgi:hypothetical protein
MGSSSSRGVPRANGKDEGILKPLFHQPAMLSSRWVTPGYVPKMLGAFLLLATSMNAQNKGRSPGSALSAGGGVQRARQGGKGRPRSHSEGLKAPRPQVITVTLQAQVLKVRSRAGTFRWQKGNCVPLRMADNKAPAVPGVTVRALVGSPKTRSGSRGRRDPGVGGLGPSEEPQLHRTRNLPCLFWAWICPVHRPQHCQGP